jgi:hypothetical protein
MKRILMASGVVMASAGPAHGQGTTGEEVLRFCERDETWCVGFALGVLAGAVAGPYVCLPDAHLTAGQVRDILLKHLRAFPEQRHQPFYAAVTRALQRAWPCEG